jgi:hypothetical protein
VAGGAGGVGRTPCAQVRPSVRLSSTEKAAKLGYFGLKIPGRDRESLKGIHFFKKSGMGKENENYCPRASM